MQKLVHGVHHFQEHVFSAKKALFEGLKAGQSPEMLFITCSDSRIDPNLITQTEPGEMFVLRNTGNIIPPHGATTGGEAATIEFAIQALGIKDIIVCGHSQCGALKGLLHPDMLANMPTVAQWLTHAEATRWIIKAHYSDLPDAQKLSVAIQENVLFQLENLKTLPAVVSRLAKGDLNLHGWVYQLETGDIFSYNAEQGQFIKLSKSGHGQSLQPCPAKLSPI